MDENRKKFLEEVDKVFDTARVIAPGDLLFTYKGVQYPTAVCTTENLQALEGFEANKDDVMLVSYPKCGTNWALQILQEMVYTLANKSPPPDIPMIEFGTPDKLEQWFTEAMSLITCSFQRLEMRLKQQTSPRLLVTHLHYDNIPKSIFKNKTKKLVVFRNPKDAAVSLFYFYNNSPMFPSYSTWDEFFQHYMSGKVCWGSYFDSLLAWNKHLDDGDVLIITYEELKENLGAGVKQIAEFLGLPLTQDQIQGIANRATFQSMKAKSNETHGQFGQVLFRKGDIGDWKNLFSPSQSQEMDAKFKSSLGGTKLEAKLKYDVHCKA